MKEKVILVCDDNDFILLVTRLALETEGYAVETAMKTEEIYSKLKEIKPALILLDLNLPEEGGESVVNNLRNNIETRSIPIILFSARENLPEIASNLKVEGFLQKPFENQTLINIARKYCVK